MQIKEFEAFSLKDCLQQVRDNLGPDAVILETRKFRKGGVLGWGARDAVCIVAATGITVQNDLPPKRQVREPLTGAASAPPAKSAETAPAARTPATNTASAAAASASQAAAVTAARAAFARAASPTTSTAHAPRAEQTEISLAAAKPAAVPATRAAQSTPPMVAARENAPAHAPTKKADAESLHSLEKYMREIKESLAALQREQREAQERTVTAVVSAVAPAVSQREMLAIPEEYFAPRFPELNARLTEAGVADTLAAELLDALPDFDAWSPQAQLPLAEAALRDLIARRVASSGPIELTPGRLKAVTLIGPTGVGKTTTIAKLAAHFSLVENKKVALLTVDTYRIAAVEQLKTYSQIIDIPIAVAYSQAEVLPAVEQFKDFDLLLIDTAGRSQKNLMQVGELKTLLESLSCETHLVLSALIKERDMLDAAQRFSAARVDRLLFSKLDETSSYGTLLNVADRTGIPLSYLTTGQKVPEDIEVADGGKLADLLLAEDPSRLMTI